MNNKVIFWNVDTQVDFIMANGKLPVPEAESIIPALNSLTNIAKDNNIRVVNTCDWHNDKTEELSKEPNFIETFPEHCMENTEGAKFVDATNPSDDIYTVDFTPNEVPNLDDLVNHRNVIIRKDKFDVFSGNHTTDRIVGELTLKCKNIIVYGVAENVCVNFAVLGLLERGLNVYVVSDAIKGLPGIDSPISIWEEKGAKMISLDEVESIIKEEEVV